MISEYCQFNSGPNAADAVPVLTRTLVHQGRIVRIRSAHALGRIGTAAENSFPDLINTSEDSDPDMQISAAEALLLIDSSVSDTVPVLIDARDNNESAVQSVLRRPR